MKEYSYNKLAYICLLLLNFVYMLCLFAVLSCITVLFIYGGNKDYYYYYQFMLAILLMLYRP